MIALPDPDDRHGPRYAVEPPEGDHVHLAEPGRFQHGVQAGPGGFRARDALAHELFDDEPAPGRCNLPEGIELEADILAVVGADTGVEGGSRGVGLVGIVVALLRLAEGLLVVGGAVTLGWTTGEVDRAEPAYAVFTSPDDAVAATTTSTGRSDHAPKNEKHR